ncbi:MAG: efflux RND transporter permease subunit [Nitrospirae bacterium]|nr:efflux RND transporter permease subunit [Nitrospirota bacterium]
MWLSDTSIRRPVFATMLILILVLWGIISYPEIGVDLLPRVDFPIVNITTRLPGASPEIMDVDVTDKIEEAINTINGVKSITSSSYESTSVTTVEFVLDRDINLAVADVREKLSLVRAQLPQDIKEPIIEKVDPDANPVLWLALTSQLQSGEIQSQERPGAAKRTERELSTYANEVLKEQLQKINGVGALRMAGLRLRQVRIWLDATKMRAYEITYYDVVNALKRGNVEMPGGRIEGNSKEYSIKVKGEFTHPNQFNDLILLTIPGQTGRNAATIRLRDVGRVEDGMEEKRSIARFNGRPSVGISIQKQSGTNTVEVVDRVKKELVKIKRTLPPGMSLDISFDQSTFIKISISEVQHHLLYGGVFASLAVLLFLGNLRLTLISAIAIPTSLISTMAIMNYYKFTFNNMTMLALSLCIGILIDDAIIVIENIHRHVEAGEDPVKAAHSATSEIGMAVVATTFSIVAIFLPVAFMKGLIGRFFLQFALTVVFSVMVSMLVSFTLTPMLASRFIRHSHGDQIDNGRFNRWSEAFHSYIERLYKRMLIVAMGHRLKVLFLAGCIFAFSLYITKFIGKEMVPPEDQGRFVVRLQAPVDYSIDAVDSMFKEAEVVVSGLSEVKTLFYAQGYDMSGEINKASMFVGLVSRHERTKTQEQVKADVRRALSQAIPGLKATAEDISIVGGGLRNAPIQFIIRGSDLNALNTYTHEISDRFSKLPGIVDVDTSFELGKPEVRVLIDRDRAAELGVDVVSVAEAINILIGGEANVTHFKDNSKGRRYDVRIRLNQQDRAQPNKIEGIYVRSKSGALIGLSNVVTVIEGASASSIIRVDRQRAIILFANLENIPLGQATSQLDDIANSVLPPDYTTIYKGIAEFMGESFYYLTIAIFLGVVMAYMILAAQFESFIHPVTVLLAMPLSFIGAFGALLLTGKTLNIFSFIGLILLMGLVKKNSILIVAYTNTLKERGYKTHDAIIEACPVRLRPILMTTVAMIFGMLPIAVGLGEGSETRSPMAIATIGGLSTSLFLTLFVVPAAYELFDDIITWLKQKTGYRS